MSSPTELSLQPCSLVLCSSAPSSLVSKAYQAVLWCLLLFLWSIIHVFWLLQRILWVFFFANSLYFIVFHVLFNVFILSSCFLDGWKIFFLQYWGSNLAFMCSTHIIYEWATLPDLLFFTLRQGLTRLPRQTLNLWPFCHSLSVSWYCRPVRPAAACTTCEWVFYVTYLHTWHVLCHEFHMHAISELIFMASFPLVISYNLPTSLQVP